MADVQAFLLKWYELLLAAAVLLTLAVWYVSHFLSMAPKKGTLEWIGMTDLPRMVMPEVIPIRARSWLALLAAAIFGAANCLLRMDADFCAMAKRILADYLPGYTQEEIDGCVERAYAGKFEDPKQLFGINVPFTTKSFIAKWEGVIKAGIKADKILVEVNNTKKEIVIHIPEAEILSHEIDNDSIETLDEKNGLFNPVKVEDVREFDAISKETMENRAIENGLLDKAYENAETIIEKLVNNEIVQEQGYKIIFNKIEN